MKGTVFNLQRCSLNDGPGIRTVVFLKGCPLRCIWCHNPESYRESAQILLDPRKCTLCGRCAAVCSRHQASPDGHRFDRTDCTACGRCAEACLNDALEVCGKTMTAEEVMAEVRKDALFFRTSGGGMTLSGGEPMYQPEFALALAEAARAEGFHVALETSGMTRWEHLERMLPVVHLFLFDCKETDPERHRRFTGADNAVILDNLRRLDERGAEIVLRCPIIPGCNDRPEHLRAIGALADSLKHVLRIDIEPYHPLGLSKETRLGMNPRMENAPAMPTESQTEEWIRFLRLHTHVPVGKA